MVIEPFIESQGEHRGFWLRKPRRIGGRILVAARGARVPAADPGRVIVFLDVRSAFGTGGHGSSEGCLLALEERLRGGERVLDLGTGTGILAIAACKLGAGAVTAADIELKACREARANIDLNGATGRIAVVAGGIAAVRGPFDVVVANLRTQALAALVVEVVARLAEGGTAILSGILEAELHPFIALLRRHALDVSEVRRVRGWMTVVASRRREPVRPPGA